MIHTIISSSIFIIWSCFIAFLYYTINESHIRLINIGDITNLVIFGIYILGIYAGYKAIQQAHNTQKTQWSLWHFSGAFFIMLFGVSILYKNTLNLSEDFEKIIEPSHFGLFFSIIQYLIYPTFLVFLWKATGNTLFFWSKEWGNFPGKFRFPIETALGMGIFSLLVFVAGIFNQFHTLSLIIILIFVSILSFTGWKDLWYNFFQKKITLEGYSPLSSKTITAEMSFLILLFVMCISFVSVLRANPIGWDELGVYMNFPKIMANTGGLLQGAGIFLWHIITGTGFLIQGATQAFFVNQIGGILATIAIISGLSLLLEKIPKEGKKDIIALPMLLGIVYYIMPMTIFQQAKDMKLDPALMFASVTAIITFAQGLFVWKNSKTWSYILLGIAGIITGIAFGIKITSLMLILALIGILHYYFVGMGGFIGFFGLFTSIFTAGKLWSHLFVWMPENITFVLFGTISLTIFGYGYAFYKHRTQIKNLFVGAMIFSGGIIIAIFPWLAKNAIELEGNISIQGLLSGNGSNKPYGTFSVDYSKVYTTEEIAKRNAEYQSVNISPDGQSLNEDLNRYFGQEKGINNYIKMPVNLTFQFNQGNAFTDITFIFLAFTPVALLFFPITNKRRRIVWIVGVSFFLLLSLFTFGKAFIRLIELFGVTNIQESALYSYNEALTQFFANIKLPVAYAVLSGLIGAFLMLAHYCFKDEENSPIYTGILLLGGLYGFIFWISTFGIVWYGVTIYFILLCIIALGIHAINNEHRPGNMLSIIQVFVISVFTCLLGVYFFRSVTVHSYHNLQTAGTGFEKYKAINYSSALFLQKPDYFIPILELNIRDKNAFLQKIENILGKSPLSEFFTKNNTSSPKERLEQIDNILFYLWKESKTGNMFSTKKHALASIQESFHKEILNPPEDNSNTEGVYRVGTFLTYYIYNNRKRFLEDNLLFEFQKYFYHKNNPAKTAEIMEKLGLKYFLLDLNVATIDRDERRALTERYENALLTLRDENFELIATDSICLRLAIDEFRQGKLQDEQEFLEIVTGNYDTLINRKGERAPKAARKKHYSCYAYIRDNKLYEKYPYITLEAVETIKRQLQSPESIFSYALWKIKTQKISH